MYIISQLNILQKYSCIYTKSWIFRTDGNNYENLDEKQKQDQSEMLAKQGRQFRKKKNFVVHVITSIWSFFYISPALFLYISITTNGQSLVFHLQYSYTS